MFAFEDVAAFEAEEGIGIPSILRLFGVEDAGNEENRGVGSALINRPCSSTLVECFDEDVGSVCGADFGTGANALVGSLEGAGESGADAV